MLSGYKILTINHHTAGLTDIEKFIIKSDNIAVDLQAIKAENQIQEILYLATCNRVCYFIYDDNKYDQTKIFSFFRSINSGFNNSTWSNLKNKVEVFEGKEAIQHLFEMACSINSMVIGEREIFRQLREAFEFSRSNNLSGDNIRLAMRFTIETAKSAYANTAIGEKPLSVVSLAFNKMMKFGPEKNARILMIGAGQTNTLFSKFLLKYGFNNVSVFNRSLSGAERISKQLNGKAYQLNQLTDYKNGFDILVVCTSSIDPLITLPVYNQLVGNEKESKIVIDLSVPNNVDRQLVSEIKFNFIEVESLKRIASENLEHRKTEITAVKIIINEFLNDFTLAYKQRLIERALKDVPAEIKEIKIKASKVFKKEIDELDENSKELINKVLDYMERGCINIPMKAAKNLALTQH